MTSRSDLQVREEAPLGLAVQIKQRLLELNRKAAELIMENGLLLQRIMNQELYREWGFPSFDAAIDGLQDQGCLQYSARQARNYIAIVTMVQERGMDPKVIDGVEISKLREIATVGDAKEQTGLLEEAPTLTVKQVQEKARAIRNKALGRDVDPLHPYTLMFTETQRGVFTEALERAKIVYSFDRQTNAANVVEAICADFLAGAPLPEVEAPENEPPPPEEWME